MYTEYCIDDSHDSTLIILTIDYYVNTSLPGELIYEFDFKLAD